MRNTVKLGLLFGFAAVVSACGAPEPEPVPAAVIVDPAPLSTEPVYTGKYK